MEILNTRLKDEQREYCALTTLRRMVEKYSEDHGLSFEEAFYQFAQSYVYDALFDFETGIWKEGPDYLMSLFEESYEGEHS